MKVTSELVFSRFFAMPNSETFSIGPIRDFVKRHLQYSKLSADLFARNSRIATLTNDLNPQTAADYHMDVVEFLKMLKADEIRPDLVLFDPPYSPRQVKDCYQSIGITTSKEDCQRPTGWTTERDLINEIIAPGGTVLSFGWSTAGMGVSRGFSLNEVLLVFHGGGHNDTICIAETKDFVQPELIDLTSPH